jgi:hypothetical protein
MLKFFVIPVGFVSWILLSIGVLKRIVHEK